MLAYEAIKFSFLNLFCKSIRNCSTKLPEGIPYHGFIYYPRYEGFKDPPYTPHKLFLVRRIRPIREANIAERNILKSLDIFGKKKAKLNMAIVKNIPQVNALLWKVKHLVEVNPITWSGELPKDFRGTYLRETGKLEIFPMTKPSDEVLELSAAYENSKSRIKRKYMQKYLLKKWNSGQYNT